tara:strand:- start:2795 stop:3439 length:645 start_codon:yes stop_codon:yes gene_type:complete
MTKAEIKILWTVVWYLKHRKFAKALQMLIGMLTGKEPPSDFVVPAGRASQSKVGSIPSGSALGDKLATVAEGEVGTMEIPRNSNRGPRIEEYQRATYYATARGWPYCAAFVCWCLKRVGSLPFAAPNTPRAWAFEAWARRESLDLLKKPKTKDLQRGDIICFVISHIGIVAKVSRNGVITTVEGNTDASGGSRDGGGVYKTTRKISEIRSRIRI